VIEALPLNRADDALHVGSLPRGSRRRQNFLDPHGLHILAKLAAEDAQLALNHAKRSTTEDHYVEKTKKRYAIVNEKKRTMWEQEGMWQ
jgi:hypothetical protein